MRAATSLKLESLVDDLTRHSGLEKRTQLRKRVLLAAKISFNMTVADCSVRDLSEAGARLHAPSVLGLPDEVHLLIMREGLVIHARRVWAQFPAFGLKFLSAEPIDGCTRPQAAPLRKAWDDWLRSCPSA
jgi:PilZ domain-containing protein